MSDLAGRNACWTCLHDAEHQTDGGYGHCTCECHTEPMQNLGVTCGECGSDDCYFATCETTGGVEGHEWAVAFVCNACRARHPIECPDCAALDVFKRAEITRPGEKCPKCKKPTPIRARNWR